MTAAGRSAVGLLLACAVWGSSASAQTNRVGTAAPAPFLTTLAGDYTQLSKLYYEGEERPGQPRAVVVLSFMGLGCVPCRKELPLCLEVVRAVQATEPGGSGRLRLFLVSTDPLSRKKELRTFVEEQKVDPASELLLDPYGTVSKEFGVAAIPRTFVISARGRITADIAGAAGDYAARLKSGIEEALKDGGLAR